MYIYIYNTYIYIYILYIFYIDFLVVYPIRSHGQELLGNHAGERLRRRLTRCEAPDGFEEDGWHAPCSPS